MLTITEQDKDTAVVKFYGAIGDWYQNAEAFTSLFDPAGAKYKNILIRVHCYGGSVFEGNVIANSIQNAKPYVTMKIEGVSASMMSIVMLSANKVIIADNGLVMIHCPSGYTAGTAKEHQSTAKLLAKMEANAAKRYALKTGKPESEVRAWFDGNDHWFDAQEAKDAGLVDEIEPAVVKNITQLDKPEASTPIVAVYNRYQALLTDETKIPTKTDISMKKTLITMFALQGVTEASSDEDVVKALAEKIQTPQPQAPPSNSKASAETVLASIEKYIGKPFEASARATLLGIGEKAGLEVMQGAMALMAPAAPVAEQTPTQAAAAGVPQVVSMIGGATATGAAPGRESWDWDTYQEKDPKALAAMEDSTPKVYNALFKAKYGVEPGQ
jgi:ATP-dependent protease ClpP protease subunit